LVFFASFAQPLRLLRPEVLNSNFSSSKHYFTQSQTMNIIILGGTGFIGRHICEKLVRAGHRITVPTRKIENAREIQTLPGLQPVRCNVHDTAQLTAAVKGHDVLINLVAILHGSEEEFNRVHVQLPQTIVAACKAAGVPRMVQMSSLGAALDAPSRYLRSKGAGEQVFAQSGFDVTILRPSVVFGEGDKLLNVFAQLQQSFPVVPLAGSEAQFQPVWVEDVAQAVVNVISGLHSQNNSTPSPIYKGLLPKTLEIAGPSVLSLRQLFELAGRCVGASRPIVHLPDGLARIQAWMMERMPGPTLMSRDNLDSMKAPNIASGKRPGLRELGIEPTSIEAIAPLYLKPASKLDQFRKHASR
jgi:uncharacterized protein YbjT (DUF2867 family)